MTDSNEYEWDSLSADSCEDKQIDVIQRYTPITEEGQSSGTRPFELEPQNTDDSSEDDSTSSEIDTDEESAIIDLNIPIRICIDFGVWLWYFLHLLNFRSPPNHNLYQS